MNKFPNPGRPAGENSLLAVGQPEADLHILQNILAGSGWKIGQAGNFAAGLRYLRKGRVQVVLCERDFADGDWHALLTAIQTLDHPPALVVATAQADEYLWAEVLNLGGYDVLPKPFDIIEVRRVVDLAGYSWKRRWLPAASAGTAAGAAAQSVNG